MKQESAAIESRRYRRVSGHSKSHSFSEETSRDLACHWYPDVPTARDRMLDYLIPRKAGGSLGSGGSLLGWAGWHQVALDCCLWAVSLADAARDVTRSGYCSLVGNQRSPR